MDINVFLSCCRSGIGARKNFTPHNFIRLPEQTLQQAQKVKSFVILLLPTSSKCSRHNHTAITDVAVGFPPALFHVACQREILMDEEESCFRADIRQN